MNAYEWIQFHIDIVLFITLPHIIGEMRVCITFTTQHVCACNANVFLYRIWCQFTI